MVFNKKDVPFVVMGIGCFIDNFKLWVGGFLRDYRVCSKALVKSLTII